ncbi:MAG: hypothetical protein RL748_646 [Pseudomonadota bacterium]|jgi:long-chain acyl-CoA synthetase
MLDVANLTFPRLLLQHAKARPHDIAFREKGLGIWQTWSWQQTLDEVRSIAAGLASQGFGRGMHLAIVGDNRPHLYWSMLAAQCLGGVAVPLYQDAQAQDMTFVLRDAHVRHVVVEDQEQVDKMLEIRSQYPDLALIAYSDPRGMRNYQQPGLLSLKDLQQQGQSHHGASFEWLEAQIATGNPLDVAVILYTSGTTGNPKGVCHPHQSFITAGLGGMEFDQLSPHEDILSYLPMAWVGDFLFSFAQALAAGFTVNCPESSETVMTDLREIGPSYFFAPPRVFENLRTSLMIRMEDAGRIKRSLFHHYMQVAEKVGVAILDGKPVALADRIAYAMGEILIYAPLKDVLGLSRVRVAYTAGAAIGPELFSFYRSLGINLKQLYGSTETCAYVCLQANGQIFADRVGTPAPGVEVKISDSGEVLVKSKAMLKEYYCRPEATLEAIDAQGYFRTGDAGWFDENGSLKIIDRAADVGKLNDGSMFAPNYIENKLKFIPFIKEAVTFGNGRDQVCAFINIDLGAVGNWVERNGLAYSGYTDLACNPAVGELIAGHIAKINLSMAQESGMASSQIKRFLILHKELDPDDEELTRTRKVRRKFIAQKYAVLIDALFSSKTSQFIETQVKFEDGRVGSVSADLQIREVKTFSAQAAA